MDVKTMAKGERALIIADGHKCHLCVTNWSLFILNTTVSVVQITTICLLFVVFQKDWRVV